MLLKDNYIKKSALVFAKALLIYIDAESGKFIAYIRLENMV